MPGLGLPCPSGSSHSAALYDQVYDNRLLQYDVSVAYKHIQFNLLYSDS
jgi:hypothetical protein